MASPIEDYAMLGDGRSAALVSRDGSIDWLCLPRFDSDACFAALLGDEDNGQWQIAPCEPATARRAYQADTLVLDTEFSCASGAVRLTDCMDPESAQPTLIRMVRGLRGTVRMRCDFGAAFRLWADAAAFLSRQWRAGRGGGSAFARAALSGRAAGDRARHCRGRVRCGAGRQRRVRAGARPGALAAARTGRCGPGIATHRGILARMGWPLPS